MFILISVIVYSALFIVHNNLIYSIMFSSNVILFVLFPLNVISADEIVNPFSEVRIQASAFCLTSDDTFSKTILLINSKEFLTINLLFCVKLNYICVIKWLLCISIYLY